MDMLAGQRLTLVEQTSRPSKIRSPNEPSRSSKQTTRLRSNTTTASPAPNFSHPHPTSTIPKTRYFTIKGRTQAFCTAFLNPSNNPPSKILDEHFTSTNPRILDHGPTWAQNRLPYLARPFRGKNECLWYFRLQSETVLFQPDSSTFAGSEGIVVDADALIPGCVGRGVATVMGKAKFEAVKSGQSWEARFVWRLSGFDEEGRIGLWEVWGDCLSAYMAVGSGGGTPF